MKRDDLIKYLESLLELVREGKAVFGGLDVSIDISNNRIESIRIIIQGKL